MRTIGHFTLIARQAEAMLAHAATLSPIKPPGIEFRLPWLKAEAANDNGPASA
jgi:hypothetical protein